MKPLLFALGVALLAYSVWGAPAVKSSASKASPPKEELPSLDAFTTTPAKPDATPDYQPPPPEGASPPAGHVVLYTADAPTAAMASGTLRNVYASPGRVTYLRATGDVGTLQILPHTISRREVDFMVYFIFPDHAAAPVLRAGDKIRISGYSGDLPRIFRLKMLPAGYYDMGHHLMLQTPHRFLESGDIDEPDLAPIPGAKIDEITADGCVITLPPTFTSATYVVRVGFGRKPFTTPVFYDFVVR